MYAWTVQRCVIKFLFLFPGICHGNISCTSFMINVKMKMRKNIREMKNNCDNNGGLSTEKFYYLEIHIAKLNYVC